MEATGKYADVEGPDRGEGKDNPYLVRGEKVVEHNLLGHPSQKLSPSNSITHPSGAHI